MEATLSLTYRGLHANPLRLFTSLGDNTTIANRSLCPSGHKFGRDAQVVNALQMNGGGSDGSKARGVIGSSLVWDCVLGAKCSRRAMCGPAKVAPDGWSTFQKWPRAESEQPLDFECLSAKDIEENWNIASPKRPDSVVKALLEMGRGQLKDSDGDCFCCLIRMKEGTIPFNQLRHFAWKLELSDKLPKAVTYLEDQFYNYIFILKKGGTKAYEEGLLLIEMLIYKGEYENAERLLPKVIEMATRSSKTSIVVEKNEYDVAENKVLEDMKMDVVSDATPLLYKAVINWMSDRESEAQKMYELYKKKKNIHEPAKADEAPEFEKIKSEMIKLREKIKENMKNIEALKK